MEALRNYIEQIRSYTGADLYIVGGFIRDYLLDREIDDIDIVVKNSAIEIAKEFAYNVEGSFIVLDDLHGVARVVMKDKNISIDFANMNGEDIYQDLHSRDFTINAMALKVEKDGAFDLSRIIDHFNGRRDVENKIIKMIQPKAFKEDPLRILRGVRLMAELEFDLDEDTIIAMKEQGEFITNVSPERISYELFRILKCQRTHYYFNLMDKYLNILEKIFPEIEPMKDVGRCKYHVVDSWTHSLYTLNVAESIIYADGYFEGHLKKAYEEHTHQILGGGHTRLQLIKLAALFHDIGKPGAQHVDQTGRIRFRGHEIVGMEIMANIAERLRLSNKEKAFLCKMVKEHMWPLTLYKENDVSGRAIYGLFKNFGEDTLDVLLVSLADIIATRKLLHPHEEMGMYKVHMEYLANNYLTRFKNIVDISHVINGNDIMRNFKIQDHREIGNMIEAVRKAIFFGKIPPEKERAVQYIHDEILNNRM